MELKGAAKLRFLVVDDQLHIRKIIKAVCSSMGIGEVYEAQDGRAAFDILKGIAPICRNFGRKRNFDLVICDWMMPNMCGLELLTKVREDRNLKKLPFLMVTAENEKNMVVKAIEEGVNDFVVKPFTADVLQEKIEKVLAAQKEN